MSEVEWGALAMMAGQAADPPRKRTGDGGGVRVLPASLLMGLRVALALVR